MIQPQKVTVLGEEFEFDYYDADDKERLEQGAPLLVQVLSSEGDLETADGMRKACRSVFDFFNTLFGEGADKKIFGTKTNLLHCVDAMYEFFAAIGMDSEERVKQIIGGNAGKYLAERAARKARP